MKNSESRSSVSPALSVLCLGDVVGRPGRRALMKLLPGLRERHGIDVVIVNGENASGGLGFDAECAREFENARVDLITLGDHTWQRNGVEDYLEKNKHWCVRPANYPVGAPGTGWLVRDLGGGVKLGLFNLLGRVYINSPLDCPFRAADEILSGPLADCSIRILDMHAGATSEKVAMGRYLDGRVNLVFGTHTHVQTADEQVLPAGTGYLTDLGMCGALNGVIGMSSEVALARFLSGMHHSYKIATGPAQVNGLIAVFERATGKVLKLERVREIVSSQEG